jgi:aryl-alcohol dehydrogenase-like predicted oxidoreductase
MNRRSLLGVGAMGLAGGVTGLTACKDKAATRKEQGAPNKPASMPTNTMPMRQLGRTGVTVSAIGIGGAHLGSQEDEEESIAIVRSAIDRGVTFLDNCWDYHGGKSEERMGKALRDGYRSRAFLMTKLDGRTNESARDQLEQSLRRLQTDVIDLVQIHEVIRPDDPDRAFREGGCIEALVAAKAAGKIRFIGFTGHKDPSIHLAMLKAADAHGFTFDTVQMPLNVMDAHYRSFEKLVLPVALSKNMGILGMKSMGDKIILESKVVTAPECLRYALSLPTSVVITGCDSMSVLDQAIDAAVNFRPYTQAETAELLGRTARLAKDGTYEKFKTSDRFDSTSHNPKWLTSAEI